MGKHYFKCLACGREEQQYIGVKYFQMPENSDRKAKWLHCINKPDNPQISRDLRVCERHISDDMNGDNLKQRLKRKAKWLHCLNKQELLNQQISRDFRVCERHFSEDMYAKSKQRLKKSAIPTLEILKLEPITLNEDIQIKESLSCVPVEAGIDSIAFDESFNASVKVEELDEHLSNEIEAIDRSHEETSTEEQKCTKASFTKIEEVLNLKEECESVKEEAGIDGIEFDEFCNALLKEEELDEHLSNETEAIERFDGIMETSTEEQKFTQTAFTIKEEVLNLQHECENIKEEIEIVEKSTKEHKYTQTSFTEKEEIYNLRKECESLKRELEKLKKEKFS